MCLWGAADYLPAAYGSPCLGASWLNGQVIISKADFGQLMFRPKGSKQQDVICHLMTRFHKGSETLFVQEMRACLTVSSAASSAISSKSVCMAFCGSERSSQGTLRALPLLVLLAVHRPRSLQSAKLLKDWAMPEPWLRSWAMESRKRAALRQKVCHQPAPSPWPSHLLAQGHRRKARALDVCPQGFLGAEHFAKGAANGEVRKCPKAAPKTNSGMSHTSAPTASKSQSYELFKARSRFCRHCWAVPSTPANSGSTGIRPLTSDLRLCRKVHQRETI